LSERKAGTMYRMQKCDKRNFPWFVIWLIHYLLFYVPIKNFLLIHCRWRAAKFKQILAAQGFEQGGSFIVTPTITRDLGFSGLIRRTTTFSRLLRHAWGYRGPFLTRILTGCLWFYMIYIQLLVCFPRQGSEIENIQFVGYKSCTCKITNHGRSYVYAISKSNKGMIIQTDRDS
jgi:hypothetical protein